MDQITPRMIGKVRTYIDYPDGTSVLHEEKNNLVVNEAQFSVVEALAGLNSGHIAAFKYGALASAADPDHSDIDNSDPAAILKSFNGIGIDINVSGREVEYTLVLDKTEGNGTGSVQYTEMTLHANSGKLVARYKFLTPMPKDATIRIRNIWTLGYS